MKPSDSDLESILRQAPRPRPTPGLRRQLIDDIALLSPSVAAPAAAVLQVPWFQRWRFALSGGAAAALCLVVLALQQAQIHRLQDTIEVLQQQLEPPPTLPGPVPQATPPAAPANAPASGPEAEIQELRLTAGRLAAEVAALEALRSENARLKDQLVAGSGAAPEDLAAMAEARQKAQSIVCINNLKQLGLAVRIWATDHDDQLPPDLLSMTNEMVTPKILVCPSDTSHLPATGWDVFGPANSSYEFLAPGEPGYEPSRVLFQCPVHGHIGLGDGSVQSSQAKTHPERFQMREGKLYFVASTPTNPSGTLPGAKLDPRLQERYGLTPPAGQPAQPASQYDQFSGQGAGAGAPPETEDEPQP